MYAIFYKEWIKTRWYFLLAVLATLGFTGYCMLRINRVVEMKGAAHVWEVMLQRDVIFIDMLQYIPLIAGILMAIVQFVPEMQRKCLKLTLHLPYPELKMTGNMLLSGLILILVCFASNFLLMEVYLNGILAHELKNHILLTALTWYLAGISGYLLVAWLTCQMHRYNGLCPWRNLAFDILRINIVCFRINICKNRCSTAVEHTV